MSLAELRREFSVGELMNGDHDTTPTEVIKTPNFMTSFASIAQPENTVVETHPELSVQDMVDRGLLSRGELMTGGTPKINSPS